MTDAIAPDQALFTDLYELKMLQAYRRERMAGIAVFDLFVRRLPPGRGFLLAAGIEDALDYLERLRFRPDRLDYLAGLGDFSPEFVASLAAFRFTGRVRAVAEGTPVFPHQPLLEVIAPIAEAQLVETWLINQVSFQTLAASKGVRAVLAAQGKPVIDFGARRAQGSDAASRRHGRFIWPAFTPPPTCLPVSVSAFRSPAPWRIATSRPTTTSWSRYGNSPRSIRQPRCWWTPMTPRPASAG